MPTYAAQVLTGYNIMHELTALQLQLNMHVVYKTDRMYLQLLVQWLVQCE